MTPKTYRIGIGSRLAALLLACNLVPFFSIIATLKGVLAYNKNTAAITKQLSSNIMVTALVFMGAGTLLTFLAARNLKQPFADIIRVLKNIRKGDFDQKVKVTSNDEIGYTGDMINKMSEGLKERDRA